MEQPESASSKPSEVSGSRTEDFQQRILAMLEGAALALLENRLRKKDAAAKRQLQEKDAAAEQQLAETRKELEKSRELVSQYESKFSDINELMNSIMGSDDDVFSESVMEDFEAVVRLIRGVEEEEEEEEEEPIEEEEEEEEEEEVHAPIEKEVEKSYKQDDEHTLRVESLDALLDMEEPADEGGDVSSAITHCKSQADIVRDGLRGSGWGVPKWDSDHEFSVECHDCEGHAFFNVHVMDLTHKGKFFAVSVLVTAAPHRAGNIRPNDALDSFTYIVDKRKLTRRRLSPIPGCPRGGPWMERRASELSELYML